MNRLFRLFAFLAILISVLGVSGLAAFSASRRTKEIGIRKVNGAHYFNLLWVLIVSNIKYVIVAVCMAIPIGWYLMDRWLRDFVYKTGLPWWIFAVAGLLTLVIILLTVGIQVYKTVMANPVNSLRYE